MSRRLLALFLAVTLVVSAVPAAAVQEEQVIGSPEIDVSAPDNRFSPSERGALNVVVSNAGDVKLGGPAPFTERVTTARNVHVSVLEDRVDAPIEFKSGTVVLGAVNTARPATATFELETAENLEPGTYRIPVRIEYDYTRIVTYEKTRSPPGYQNPEFADSAHDRIETVEVVVERDSRFDVSSAESTGVYAGDTGRLNVSVTNTGTETARDATLQLSSGSPSVYFGPQTNPQQSTTVFVSELAPGESATASVEVGATAETTPGSYPVEARVIYENDNGVMTKSDPLPTEVQVGDERRFTLENLQTERLRVGEDDVVVTGEIVNHGPAPAANAVVKLAAGSSAAGAGAGPNGAPGGAGGAASAASGAGGPILVTSPESGIGTLEPGDSQPVRFKLAVSEDAEPGSQTLNFVVEYENSDGDLRQSTTPIRKSVEVGSELDTFEVVDTQTSVTAGGSDALQVTVENTGDETVSDANAKLFVNDPLSAPDNSAFLGELEPGETTTATFKIEATGQAQAKEYAGSLEVRYEDESGDSQLADGIQVGVPVAPASGGLPLTYIGLGLGVVVLSGGVFAWRRS
jgi:hypothetical protein